MPRAARTSLFLAAIAIGVAAVAGSTSRADEEKPPESPPPAPSPETPATPAPEAPAVPAPAAPAPATPAPAVPAAGKAPKEFASVEEGAKALLAAFETNDDAALREIAGEGNEDVVQDGKDPVVAAQRRELAEAAKARLSFDRDAPDGRVFLVVGETRYPLAVPFAKGPGGWHVDAEAGRKELLERRIGEHELEAVGIALDYADAQVAYAKVDRDGDGVKEYAQKIASTPGSRDGLHWESAEGEDPSPIAGALAPLKEALEPGATPKPPPFNGYYWRILKAQGAHAPGGAHSYVINGNMIAGFALLGVPAVHRNTGVMSFLVSHHGKVFEKDLGPDTLKVAASIEAFDPDASWREVDERTLRDAAGSSPLDAPFVGSPDGGNDVVSPATLTGGVPVPVQGTVPARGTPCPR